MFEIDKFNIVFDVTKETPYFQVDSAHRIRFSMDELNLSLLKDILKSIFECSQPLHLMFVSEYIMDNVRCSSNSKLGRYLTIRNWKEHAVVDEFSGDGAVYTLIRNLNLTEVMNYCTQVYKGDTQAYIAFYNDDFLMYVSTDVVDIVSWDDIKIQNLKEKYAPHYNRYYDN
ncbi:hypothetical protein [Exiguobacterium sp. s131]|uniref:hypothetical protein n=1 Tax=Exiguobacterium sp. s131 TaxID=2751278 RepID=UPI001BEA1A57|nr:hypothetical protein [Exiguobacterium sp. s131]